MNQYVREIEALALEIGNLQTDIRKMERKLERLPRTAEKEKELGLLKARLAEKQQDANALLRSLWVVQS